MQDRVKGPAIALIVTGALGIFLYAASLFTDTLLAALMRAFTVPEKDLQKSLDSMHPFGRTFDYAQIGIGLALSLFVLYGGMQMMKLRHRGIVMAAAITALIPCIGPCCLVGIPIGIWVLVTISKPDVKTAFTN
jgi:hypothetical protein